MASIGCEHPGCLGPADVKCAGYEGPCGRLACHDHSINGLCWVCESTRSGDQDLTDLTPTEAHEGADIVARTGYVNIHHPKISKFCLILQLAK